MSTKVAVFSGSDMRSFGGGEKDIIGWVNGVAELDFTIFSFLDKSNLRITFEEVRKLIKPTVKITYYRAQKINLLRDLLPLSFSGFRALSSIRKFQTVYSMHQGLILNYFLHVACRTFKKKFILGIHSPIFFDEEPLDVNWLKKRLMKIFVAFRRHLVRRLKFARVQNRKDTQRLIDYGFSGEIYNIPPHIIEEKEFTPTLDGKQFIALFVGRLSVKHKGIDLLRSIIDDLMEKREQIQFHIIGSGNDGEPLADELSRKYPKNVIWRGFVTDDELQKEYISASLFLFPSRAENFGISLAEAQSYGIPAVAFRVMGSEDVLAEKHQGVLVEPFDTAQFSLRVAEYFHMWQKNRDAYLDLKKKISKIARARFSDSIIFEKMKSMFNNLE